MSNTKINFNPLKHEYTTEEGTLLMPVTTFVKRFFPQFDPFGDIARGKALEEGVTEEVIKARWKESGRIAMERGRAVHSTAEAIIRAYKENKETAEYPCIPVCAAEICSVLKELSVRGFTPCETEHIVGSPELRIAGTIDALFRNSSDEYLLVDWKTNREIRANNGFGKNGYPPINYLTDCNYVHYALQLSTYRYLSHLTEKRNIITQFIVHFNERDKNGYYKMAVSYLETEVENMLEAMHQNK
jgi:ATP-dependent exoDNAse (exonuclease V) beta subunit